MGSKIIKVILLCLMPFMASAQFGLRTSDSTIVTTIGGTIIPYKSWPYVLNAINLKQALLVSGTTIKTIGGVSILGSGNIAVGSTGTVTSVAATGGYGIVTPVVTNPTTTPSISIAVDSTSAGGIVSKGRLNNALANYMDLGTIQTASARKTFTAGIKSGYIDNTTGYLYTNAVNLTNFGISRPSSGSNEVNIGAGASQFLMASSTGNLNFTLPVNAGPNTATWRAIDGTVAYLSDLPIPYTFSTTGTAQTTFTVTIGQTMDNTTYKVSVTPTSMLAAASYYVPDANKTTTTFDVVYLTGITGLVSFEGAVFK